LGTSRFRFPRTPEEALEFPKHFLTYAMTYASDEDIEILRKYFSDDDFRATLGIPGGSEGPFSPSLRYLVRTTPH
jgi:hypothetical protein